MTTLQNVKKAAFDAGKRAFAAGINCAPVLDAEFMATLPNEINRENNERNCAALREWARGWMTANFAEEVPCE